ncbi:hypothetical protein [Acinetobacter sp. A47]|uniref:hypothetical protein n=1 Tax=Acinetobacter sp. A47 TaxID=1561217 RepID=UPI00056E31A7|nr:hypothetical protein [Acinetobacter sp. A47]
MTKITRARYDLQQRIEVAFDKRLIFKKAYAEIMASPELVAIMDEGADILTDWILDDHFDMKAERVAQLCALDIKELVYKIITEIALSAQKPIPLVSISAKCAALLKMADNVKAIQTMAEVISVLADIDLFDAGKISNSKDASYMIMSKITLDPETEAFMYQATYLPPMIHRPKKLRHNRSSGYLTQQGDSLILGGFQNHHDWDICLDVLNIMNSNEFELDIEFLSTVEEPEPKPTKQDGVTYMSKDQRAMEAFAIENFEKYKKQCYFLYMYLNSKGNSVFFTHKVDKRGRIYACGYHLSPQGNSFKKGMLNSKKKEVPTGIEAFLGA